MIADHAEKMSLPTTISGFTVLPISYSSDTKHYIYARAHVGSKKHASTSKPVLPEGRTLFLVNVPPDATQRDLVKLFSSSGTVEKVVFDLDDASATAEILDPDTDSEGEDADAGDTEAPQADENEDTSAPRKRRKLSKPERPPRVTPLPTRPLRQLRPTGRSAHLVFLDASSLARALDPAAPKGKSSRTWTWPTAGGGADADAEPSGLAHYTALYDSRRPPLDAVRAHADSYMALFEFEQRQAQRQSKYHKGEAIVDEDGFTLVTRGGAYGQTLGGGVAVASKKFQETGETTTNRKKKEKKEKVNFYAFQKAEKQRNELLELKKNWEADKAKVEKLKASRRFKPY
ncbi:unnamed protein product [Mycena citricolor]|uniref:RRM domain-containing protein n=1 Tax=Mycena citricolor TaxID=2018698 RepID=A0AAD2GVW0_9AGAR|nr:unnamed protein product [Mycena citricolor]